MHKSVIYCQSVSLDGLLVYVVKVFMFFYLFVVKFECMLFRPLPNGNRLLFKCNLLTQHPALESVFEKSQLVMGDKLFPPLGKCLS